MAHSSNERNMERRIFLKGTLFASGSILLGGAIIHRLLNDKETADSPLPSTIEKTHQGNGRNVLVLMSAGTRHGNTDRLTDAYIKGLVERDILSQKFIWEACASKGAEDVECVSVLYTNVL